MCPNRLLTGLGLLLKVVFLINSRVASQINHCAVVQLVISLSNIIVPGSYQSDL